MKSIASFFQSGGSSLVVLAPAGGRVAKTFGRAEIDPRFRGHLLSEMQRFRGGVYLHDGAILPGELTRDGRHCLPIDEDSWHMLTLRNDGSVCACLRFTEQTAARHFEQLSVRHSALTHSDVWAPRLKRAVEAEMNYAKSSRIRFGEVGGWAIAPERRLTMEPLRTILATYALLELLGGCSGIATATRRHGSAPILRKIGLSPLVIEGTELPHYYDDRYRCEMEVLRYDSRSPNPKFRNWVDELASFLLSAPVIYSREPHQAPERERVPFPMNGIPVPALATSF